MMLLRRSPNDESWQFVHFVKSVNFSTRDKTPEDLFCVIHNEGVSNLPSSILELRYVDQDNQFREFIAVPPPDIQYKMGSNWLAIYENPDLDHYGFWIRFGNLSYRATIKIVTLWVEAMLPFVRAENKSIVDAASLLRRWLSGEIEGREVYRGYSRLMNERELDGGGQAAHALYKVFIKDDESQKSKASVLLSHLASDYSLYQRPPYKLSNKLILPILHRELPFRRCIPGLLVKE